MVKKLLSIVVLSQLLICAVLAGEKKPSDLDKKKAELTSSIQQYQDGRTKECREALEKLMREKNFQLEAEMRMTNRGNVSEIKIVPQD